MNSKKIQAILHVIDEYLDLLNQDFYDCSIIIEKLLAIMYRRFWNELSKYAVTAPAFLAQSEIIYPYMRNQLFYDADNIAFSLECSDEFFIDYSLENHLYFTQNSTYMMAYIKQCTIYTSEYARKIINDTGEMLETFDYDTAIRENIPYEWKDQELIQNEEFRSFFECLCQYEPYLDMCIMKIEEYANVKLLLHQHPRDSLLKSISHKVEYFKNYSDRQGCNLAFSFLETSTSFYFISALGLYSDEVTTFEYWNVNPKEYLIKLYLDFAIRLALTKYKKQDIRKEPNNA